MPSGLPDIASLLVDWQGRCGRHGLPWQLDRSPYRVWLSEVMLQQTQVATVLGYFGRFVDRFPDVAALAAASLDEVLALWSGLGYYSRARNLHRCARVVVEQLGGRFPSHAAELAELPGIGPSTAAAIAAFCHGERVSILDGNVRRVLARLLAFDADLAEAASGRRLQALADQLVPDGSGEMPAYTQGLMDLGATVCTPRAPRCGECPLRTQCRSAAAGTMLDFPVRSRRLRRSRRENWCLWVEALGQVWLQQRPATGVWAGLWTWPLLDDATTLDRCTQALQCVVSGGKPGTAGVTATRLPSFVHVLTHLDWTLHPVRLEWPGCADSGHPGELPARLGAVLQAELGPGCWHARSSLDGLALPAPLRRHLLGGVSR